MDHLWTDTRPPLGHPSLELQFPYICDADTYTYDESRPWHSFLSEADSAALLSSITTDTGTDNHSTNHMAVASKLQKWIFFGLIKEIFGIFSIDFVLDDFLITTSGGKQIITTHSFHRQLWSFTTIFYGYSLRWAESPKPHRAVEAVNAATDQILLFQEAIKSHPSSRSLLSATRSEVLDPAGFLIEKVLLQSTLLIEMLQRMLPENAAISTRDFRIQERHMPMNPVTRRLLETSKWCIGDIRLHNITFPSSLLFLAMLKNYRSQNHTYCTETQCVAYQIDEKTYRTAHLTEDCSCEMLPKEADQLLAEPAQAILAAGQIPVVKAIPAPDDPADFRLVYEAATPETRYVCISHVWSDGFGNPYTNTLPACVLKYIQSLVNAIPDQETLPSTSDPTPFWMDTLCVPLPPQYRKLAIRKMGETYAAAQGILVIDYGLRTHEAKSTGPADIQEQLIRITSSAWMQRLWTFQEVCLAQTAWFQFLPDPAQLSSQTDLTHFHPQTSATSESLQSSITSHLPLATSIVKLFLSVPVEQRTSSDQRALIRLARALSAEDDVFSLPEEILSFVMETISTHVPDYRCTPEDDRLYTKIRQPFNFWPVMDVSFTRLLKITSQGSDAWGFGATRKVDLALQTDGLQGRTSTKMGDEAVCLGTLCGIDVGEILAIDDADGSKGTRMRKLLEVVGELGTGFLFGRYTRSRGADGWRWAPRTFTEVGMGVVHVVRVDPAPRGKIRRDGGRGLEVVFRGLTWVAKWEDLKGSRREGWLASYRGMDSVKGVPAAIDILLRDDFHSEMEDPNFDDLDWVSNGDKEVCLGLLLPAISVPNVACLVQVIKEVNEDGETVVHGRWMANVWVALRGQPVPEQGMGRMAGVGDIEMTYRREQKWVIM